MSEAEFEQLISLAPILIISFFVGVASFFTQQEKEVENKFVERLRKALDTKEVELKDGTVVSNMDAIIDNLIGKAIDGDKESIKLIKDLTNN